MTDSAGGCAGLLMQNKGENHVYVGTGELTVLSWYPKLKFPLL